MAFGLLGVECKTYGRIVSITQEIRMKRAKMPDFSKKWASRTKKNRILVHADYRWLKYDRLLVRQPVSPPNERAGRKRRPERAKHTSPGQRPGSAATETIALKGRDIKIHSGNYYCLEKHYVAPFQGCSFNYRQPGALPQAGMFNPFGVFLISVGWRSGNVVRET